jgi:predicted ATPase
MNQLVILAANGPNASSFLISKLHEWKEKNQDILIFQFPELKFEFNSVVPLAQCEFEVKAKEIVQQLKHTNICLCTHSDLVLHHLRLQVALGEISFEQIKIIFYDLTIEEFNDITITLTKSSGLSSWPRAFFDGVEKALCKLMMTTLERRKKEKDQK